MERRFDLVVVGTGVTSAVASRCREAGWTVAVVDGRRWMPVESFADLNHVMPDVSGFQRPLAREILNAIDS